MPDTFLGKAIENGANGTILGFDYGTKSIGVAKGQMITYTASPLAAVQVTSSDAYWDDIKKHIDKWAPIAAVIGLPLNMDGTRQALTDAAENFAKQIHGRFGLPVYLQDERLSTASAKEMLFNEKGFKGLDKGSIDSMAANEILTSWLASIAN